MGLPRDSRVVIITGTNSGEERDADPEHPEPGNPTHVNKPAPDKGTGLLMPADGSGWLRGHF